MFQAGGAQPAARRHREWFGRFLPFQSCHAGDLCGVGEELGREACGAWTRVRSVWRVGVVGLGSAGKAISDDRDKALDYARRSHGDLPTPPAHRRRLRLNTPIHDRARRCRLRCTAAARSARGAPDRLGRTSLRKSGSRWRIVVGAVVWRAGPTNKSEGRTITIGRSR